MSSRDFSLIETDHLFFMRSATEAQADREAHLLELRQSFPELRRLDWLDIGCSQGEFTSSLCQEWNWPSSHLSLGLLEPVETHRRVAIEVLSRFTQLPPREVLDLSMEKHASFDVVLANHSCYYVEQVEQTIKELSRLLRPEGLGIIAIAGANNFLIELWKTGFESMGQSVPYWIAEDCQIAFEKLDISFREKKVSYEINFADSQENRDRILRFLFGEYWSRLNREPLRASFSEYRHGDEVQIKTDCHHFIFTGSNP
jgi:SAM-dependent methyltransferase